MSLRAAEHTSDKSVPRRLWLWGAFVLLAASSPGRVHADPAHTQTTRPNEPSGLERVLVADQDRLVHRFDFDEQPLGNYEPLPMRWDRHVAVGFPQYLHAGFDERIGYETPPSFRFDLDGGSMAFHYRSRSIEVIPTSDYIIFAWVRTAGLVRARALLSAELMDRSGATLDGTRVFSEPIGGPAVDERWQRIHVRLPGGVRDARFIALTLWLVQPGRIDAYPTPPGPTTESVEDVHGSAWFDDIRVYRLPRVEMETGVAGNVFDSDTAASLKILVSDPDGAGLKAQCTIEDAGWRALVEQPITIAPISQRKPQQIPLTDLDPGLYHARLSVDTATGTLVTRGLDFARLGLAAHNPRTRIGLGEGFGVVLDEDTGVVPEGALHAIESLGVRWIKVPIWSYQPDTGGALEVPPDQAEAMFSRLVRSGHEIIGWISPEHVSIASSQGTGTLLDALDSNVDNWQPSLAYCWSLYTGLVNYWQLGNEMDNGLVWDPRLPAALRHLNKVMAALIDRPHLVMPDNVLHDRREREQPTESSAVAAFVPSIVPPSAFTPQWAASPDAQQRLWLTLTPLSQTAYPRLARLTDLAKRLILGKAIGAEVMFLRQPWIPAPTGDVSPTEEYLVLRTCATMLGSAKPIGMYEMDGRVRCYAFDRNGQAVLALWDDYAPDKPNVHWLALDPGARQVDLWGRVEHPQPNAGQTPVRVGRIPSFVDSMPSWLVSFRQSFAVDPPHVEASLRRHNAVLRFANTFSHPISGSVRLVPPPRWAADPSYLSFALRPGESYERSITLTFPINESAGTKVILAEFEIDAERIHRMRVPAWFNLGLDGIEVDTFTQRMGSQIIVRQSVTNHTAEPVSFYGNLFVPKRQELQRLIANLAPGKTITKQYEFDAAGLPSGNWMRLGLREVNGDRVWNRLVQIP
jgi:hypothetical protein